MLHLHLTAIWIQQKGMKRKSEENRTQQNESPSEGKMSCRSYAEEKPDVPEVLGSGDGNVLEKLSDGQVLEKSGDGNVLGKMSDDQVLEEFGDRNVLKKMSDDQAVEKSGDGSDGQVPEKSGDGNVLEKMSDDQVLEKSGDGNVLGKMSDDQVLEESGDRNALKKMSDDQALEKSGDGNALKQKPDDQNIEKPESPKVLDKTSALIQKYGCPRSSTDEYEILEFIGEGTFGEVAKCLKKGSNEEVALKISKKAISDKFFHETLVLRFVSEANSHEFNIVRYWEKFTHEENYFMVFELLERNLLDYMEEDYFRPFPMEGMRYITQQLLVALGKLKDIHIIHGDLKPENIMLVNHKQHPFKIKIIDFGTATLLPTHEYGTKVGTVCYRAPEIMLGRSYCESADMWSTGCLLVEMLVGEILYPGDIPYDQIRFIYETQGPFPEHMLNSNEVAAEYFCKEEGKDGNQCKWRVKNPEEYKADTGNIPSDDRKYHLKSLDALLDVCSVVRRRFKDEDNADWKYCIDLMKRMLTIDKEDRISPYDALKCKFIRREKVQ